jgi:hypothetical protein
MQVRIFLLIFSLLAGPVFAGRLLPQDAQKGELRGHSYPQVQIDGQVYRMAPGVRLYDTSNRTILPAQLPQQSNVYYRLDRNGDLTQLWLATPEEQGQAQ